MAASPSFTLGDLPLDRPISIAELARKSRPPVKTHVMRRALFSARAVHPDKGLLIRVNGRWLVPSIAKLREAWPHVFKTFMGPEVAERLEVEVRGLKRDLGSVRARLRASEEARKADRELISLLTDGLSRVTGEVAGLRVDLQEVLAESSRGRAG